MSVELGYYRHFKGNIYQVIGVGKFTEQLDSTDGLLDVVIYKAMYVSESYGPNALWVRPLAVWLNPAVVNGAKVPRFVKLTDEEAKAALPSPKV
jgi:hypothetical protein